MRKDYGGCKIQKQTSKLSTPRHSLYSARMYDLISLAIISKSWCRLLSKRKSTASSVRNFVLAYYAFSVYATFSVFQDSSSRPVGVTVQMLLGCFVREVYIVENVLRGCLLVGVAEGSQDSLPLLSTRYTLHCTGTCTSTSTRYLVPSLTLQGYCVLLAVSETSQSNLPLR
jgi:hypothetical protein